MRRAAHRLRRLGALTLTAGLSVLGAGVAVTLAVRFIRTRPALLDRVRWPDEAVIGSTASRAWWNAG